MKKRTVAGLILAAAIGCLSGCGTADIDRDTLSLSKEGTATYTILTDFSEPEYDLEELMDMAEAEVTAYGAGVEITKSDLEEGRLHFEYTFDSLRDYADFMDTSCYMGTVAQAGQNRYHLSAQMTSVKDGREYAIDVESMGDYNIFIWSEAVAVRCDGEVLYYSSNLEAVSKVDAAPLSDSTGPYYVIYK